MFVYSVKQGNKTCLDDFVKNVNNTVGGINVGFNNSSDSSGLVGEGHSCVTNVDSHGRATDSLNNKPVTEVARQNLMMNQNMKIK